MKEFKLEYFQEAARFLQRHPKVSVKRDLSRQGTREDLVVTPMW